jgi:hypothetical protein
MVIATPIKVAKITSIQRLLFIANPVLSHKGIELLSPFVLLASSFLWL